MLISSQVKNVLLEYHNSGRHTFLHNCILNTSRVLFSIENEL